MEGRLFGAPAISDDGRVIFGSFNNSVYFLNAADGSLWWEFKTGGNVWSSPALDAEHIVYIGSDDGNVYALDYLNKVKKWAYSRGAYGRFDQCSAPLLGANGDLFIGAHNKVLCLNRTDGGFKWAYDAKSEIKTFPAMGADGTLYVTTWDGRLLALWTDSTNGLYPVAWPKYGHDSRNSELFTPSGPAILTQPADQFVAVGDTAAFSVTVAPGNAVTCQWRFNDTPIDGATGDKLTLTQVRRDQQGVYAVWVSNDRGTTKSASARLTVNTPPTLSPIADLQGAEGQLISAPMAATDIDGQTLRYRFDVNPPSGATIDPNTGRFAWTPGEAQGPGVYPVAIVVSDNGTPSLSATQTFTVAVSEVNVAPRLAAIADQQVNEGSTLTLDFSATDADLPTNQLRFSLSIDAPGGAILDKDSGVFTWTPTVAQSPGTYPITVQVADDGVPPLSDARTFTVTVAQTTQAPAIVSPPQALVVTNGATAVFRVTATGTAPLQYQWFRNGNPISGATIPELTISPAQTSDASLYTVTVTNLRGTQKSAAAGLIINTPPTAVGQSIVTDEDVPLAILLTGGDPDGDTLNYQLASRPTHGKLTGKSPNLVYTPDTNYFGTDSFAFSVNDGWVDSAPVLIAITVKPVNDAPVMAPIADLTVNENELLRCMVTATDVDAGDVLAYRLAPNSPTGAKLDAVTGEFTWTPTEAQGPSTNKITVTATDLGGLSATQTFTVIVREVNSAAVLADIPSQTVKQGDTLRLQAVATDPDWPTNRLTFSLGPGFPAGVQIDAASGEILWTVAASQSPGANRVTVIVTDDGVPAYADTNSFLVVVNLLITPPVILTGPQSQTVVEGATVSFGVEATGDAP